MSQRNRHAEQESPHLDKSGLTRLLDLAHRLTARVHREDASRATPVSGPVAPTGFLAAWEREIIEEADPHTLTSSERMLATIDSVAYVVERDIAGALVECGVWRGGSVLAMIRALQEKGVSDRDVYLFDTFEGMTRPTERDTSTYDVPALATWAASERAGTVAWESLFDAKVFNLDLVRSLILGTGYPATRIHFVQGRVEDTLPDSAPQDIALLRLDTDWYESTWHELIHLYPRIADFGVLVIDDYGHWEGCRAAVDRYFREVATPILLSRIDYTGRLGVKVR